MRLFILFFNLLYNRGVKRFIIHCQNKCLRSSLGLCAKSSSFVCPMACSCPRKIFLYDNASIMAGATIIINPLSDNGRLIMKNNSGAAQNLTVITGNHQRIEASFFKDISSTHQKDEDKDVVVEEDVWIGANVTLLSGVTIGRGATVAANTVCHKSVPPYSVVMGNPAKVIGFNFTPDEIIKHEKALYAEEERLPFDLLEKNYNKYYISRIKEIKEFTRLSL